MIRRYLLAAALVTLSIPFVKADDFERVKRNLETWEANRDAERSGQPLSTLPANVIAPAGQFTLFADYNDKNEQGIAIYIVNRTDSPVTLSSQDGDVYLKLEYQDASGEWVRAQPHAYSWCGNSYVDTPLSVNRYKVFRGFVPAGGKDATVRYSLYGKSLNVHSNIGVGIVNDEDIRKAASDALAVRSGSLDFVTKVALGKIELRNEMDHITDLRSTAIRVLAGQRFSDDDVKPILQTLIEKNDEYSHIAGETLAEREQRRVEASDREK